MLRFSKHLDLKKQHEMVSTNLNNYGFPLANMDFRNILSSSTPAVPVAWCRMSADTLYVFDFDHVL